MTKAEMVNLLKSNTVAWNHWRKQENNHRERLDLSGCNLVRFSFQGADLRRVNLQGCTADFADFTLADLFDAQLGSGSFVGAHFKESAMYQIQTQGADFSSAIMCRANIEYADISCTCFDRANLSGAHLVGSNARGSSFEQTNLSGAFCEDLDLAGAQIGPRTLVVATNWHRIKGNLPLKTAVLEYIAGELQREMTPITQSLIELAQRIRG